MPPGQTHPNAEFLFSTETELLTSVLHDPEDLGGTLERFFELMREAAPTLPASGGFFNAYGRYYLDCGHVELAACECDSPAMLVSVVERQQQLVTKVVAQLQAEGRELLLANNNHSGLLTEECPIWGAHENYLVERSPRQFGTYILPFLVTRIYAGAGGVAHPSGKFVAGVRHLRMDQPTGGSTTDCRAIHSTAREEHLMGEGDGRCRYHLLLGDGHRSQFNLALQFGTTALALKAILHDSTVRRRITRLGYYQDSPWVQLLRRHNELAGPHRTLAIDPLVIDTQRVYLEAAQRYADKLGKHRPEWVAGTLETWGQTLAAMGRLDRDWLARRLDAFAKYEFYSAVLGQNGLSWQTLPKSEAMFQELALLDHSYHAFTKEDSTFRRLESAGLLDHRVVQEVGPGEEPTPHVPDTATRARARAIFIKENRNVKDAILDWSWANCSERTHLLTDPFAETFTEQEAKDGTSLARRRRRIARLVECAATQQASDDAQ